MKNGKCFLRVGGAFLALSFMAACATEKPKEPEKKWDVKVTTQGVMKTWVWKPDGSKQCAKNKPGLDRDSALKELKRSGVLTFQAKAGTTGKMMASMCGMDTGRTVEVEIAITDLPAAENMGYRQK